MPFQHPAARRGVLSQIGLHTRYCLLWDGDWALRSRCRFARMPCPPDVLLAGSDEADRTVVMFLVVPVAEARDPDAGIVEDGRRLIREDQSCSSGCGTGLRIEGIVAHRGTTEGR